MSGEFYFLKTNALHNLGRGAFEMFWTGILGYYVDEAKIPSVLSDILPKIGTDLTDRFPGRFKADGISEPYCVFATYPRDEQNRILEAAERFLADYAQGKLANKILYNDSYRETFTGKFRAVLVDLRREYETPPDCGPEEFHDGEIFADFSSPTEPRSFALNSRAVRVFLSGLLNRYLKRQEAPSVYEALMSQWAVCPEKDEGLGLPYAPNFQIWEHSPEERLAFLNAFLTFLTDFAAGKLKGVVDYNHDRHDAIVEQFTELLDFLRQAAEDGLPPGDRA